MAWRITRDYLFEAEVNPGKVGARSVVGATESHTRIPAIAAVAEFESEPLPSDNLEEVEFRLYDDDGELYYEGMLHDDDECLNQEAALRWGEGDAGCTLIKVKRGERWVVEIG